MRTEQYEQGPEEKGGAGILRNVTGTATSLLQAFLLPTILENVEKNTIITGRKKDSATSMTHQTVRHSLKIDN